MEVGDHLGTTAVVTKYAEEAVKSEEDYATIQLLQMEAPFAMGVMKRDNLAIQIFVQI